jgi:FHS family L-fucose permease-like MFS transporter
VAAVKNIFSLSNVEAQLSTFAFFIAYGIMSLPAAMLVRRLSAVRSVIAALLVMVCGCLIILLASNASAYQGVLVGLFVVASGITVLQVAANPLAAALGPPARTHFRLTLSQAFNSLGTVLGPLVGATLLLAGLDTKAGSTISAGGRVQALRSIDTAFLIIAGLIIVLVAFIWTMRGRIQAAVSRSVGSAVGLRAIVLSAVTSRWALLGGLAIFLYVGAEVSIGTQMALFLHDPLIWNEPLQHAGYYVSLYWLGATAGRFGGSALMIAIPAHRLLAVATACAAAMCLFVFTIGGSPAGYAALGIGLFNSIMFPTIFTLTLERSTAGDEATSGFLCMSIVGGALVPLVAGAISDGFGYIASFVIPLLCYAALCAFALMAGRVALPASAR